jgi:hypothetical protein
MPLSPLGFAYARLPTLSSRNADLPDEEALDLFFVSSIDSSTNDLIE